MKKYKVKYDSAFVEAAVSRVAHEIGFQDGDVVLVVLDGGVWFSSQVLRFAKDVLLRVDFIKVSSYRRGIRGEVSLVCKADLSGLEGRRVVVLDDICDSGNTLRYINGMLKGCGAKSVEFHTLIAREGYVLDEGMAFSSAIMDNSKDFFVGCGMDDNDGYGRNLDYIGVI